MTNYITSKQLMDLYSKHFYVSKEQLILIEAFISIYISSKLSGDPIWFMLVGAPSMGKTEFLNILGGMTNNDGVFDISTLTENTFLSSARGGPGSSNSLLHRIGARGLITMKDFTTILTMRPEKRDQILAQMREIYDGHMTKESGNGNSQKWSGKVCLIACVTDAIYDGENGESAGMGRRSIMYELPNLTFKKREEMGIAANAARQNIDAIRKELQEATREFIAYKLTQLETMQVVRFSETEALPFIRMANFVTTARTAVSRDWKNNLTRANSPEGPARFGSQVINLIEIMRWLRDEDNLSKEVLAFAFKIGMDSIPQQRRNSLYVLGTYDEATAKGVAIEIRLPTLSARSALEELNAHNIIERKRSENGVGADRWILKEEYRDLMKEFAGIQSNGKKLLLEDDDNTEKASIAFENFGVSDGNMDETEVAELKEVERIRNVKFINDLDAVSFLQTVKYRYSWLLSEIDRLKNDTVMRGLNKDKIQEFETEKIKIEGKIEYYKISKNEHGEWILPNNLPVK
jgi:hypothetical protein